MERPLAFDLVVQGGTLVTGGSSYRADLGISAGRIKAIGHLDTALVN